MLQLPEAEGPKEFSYDEEWLAVLRTTHALMSLQQRPAPLPGKPCRPLEASRMQPCAAPQSLDALPQQPPSVGPAVLRMKLHQ